jgi:para-aminobenzoate synthetase component 1
MSGAQATETVKALPAVREISLPVEELLQALLNLDASRRVSILDSCGARSPDARQLIAAFDPFEVVEAFNDELRVSRSGETKVLRGDVLDWLDERLERFRVRARPDGLPQGLCIATFSYDLSRGFTRLRSHAPPSPAHEPHAVLAFYDTCLVHDYLEGKTKIVSGSGTERLEEFHQILLAAKSTEQISQSENDSTSNASSPRIATSNFTREEYVRAVLRIKEHIAGGDIYQANLTQQISVPLGALKPGHVFLSLRRTHPASFAAFLQRRGDIVISASPERFLRVEVKNRERTVEAWPIKGTRPRGKDSEDDARLRAELLKSEKDLAENVMIVDLLRNDLGRVCRYGTVTVPELFALSEHPTLFHLVSKVRGQLREDVTAGAILRAAFPCGSITGAPKLRAMEILDEVEDLARGLSMGSIGYFSFDGSIDLSVAIRTMTVRAGQARFNVGGGIVADSQPEEEYEESLTKSRALLHALNARL